ncbi:MAG TPA: cupin domain-containing protein [Ktedonobacteraceae bacterium]
MSEYGTSCPPYYSLTGEGQAVWFLNTRLIVKATSEATGGALSLLESLVAPGFSPPWHIHHREDEIMYVLEGEVLFKCGENEVFQAGPGSFVFLPRGIPHSFKNNSATPARWLTLATPAGLEKFFIEAGTPALDAGLRPQPLDPQKLAMSGAQYGQEILGPSPFWK